MSEPHVYSSTRVRKSAHFSRTWPFVTPSSSQVTQLYSTEILRQAQDDGNPRRIWTLIHKPFWAREHIFLTSTAPSDRLAKTIRVRIMGVLRVLGWALLGFAFYQVVLRVVRRFWNFPVPAFIGRFLNSRYRRMMQPPSQVIERSGIVPGMTVLEVGCGSGAFTVDVARAVGSTGQVHALDVQADMLEQLKLKLARPENNDITNIETHQADAYGLPFEDESLDLIYMVTVLSEIPDQARALAECRRALKPGGILAVSEWLFDPDYSLSRAVVQRGIEAGYALQGIHGNFGHYTVRFTKLDKALYEDGFDL